MPADDIPNKIVKGVKKLLADDVTPQLGEIRGDMKAMSVRMEGLAKQVESTNRRIDDLQNHMDTRLDGLKENFNVAKDVAMLKAKAQALKEKRA